jgi:hypothetical protein
MSSFGQNFGSSRLGRSIVTAVTSGTVSQATTTIGSQTRQVRIIHNLAAGIWITFGTTAVTATANTDHYVPVNWESYFTVTPGQCFRLYQHQHQLRLR